MEATAVKSLARHRIMEIPTQQHQASTECIGQSRVGGGSQHRTDPISAKIPCAYRLHGLRVRSVGLQVSAETDCCTTLI
jgi:hypothetical protein